MFGNGKDYFITPRQEQIIRDCVQKRISKEDAIKQLKDTTKREKKKWFEK